MIFFFFLNLILNKRNSQLLIDASFGVNIKKLKSNMSTEVPNLELKNQLTNMCIFSWADEFNEELSFLTAVSTIYIDLCVFSYFLGWRGRHGCEHIQVQTVLTHRVVLHEDWLDTRGLEARGQIFKHKFQILVQSGSDWPIMRQILDFLRSVFGSFWLLEPKRTENWS